jgi:hypothetical protein
MEDRVQAMSGEHLLFDPPSATAHRMLKAPLAGAFFCATDQGSTVRRRGLPQPRSCLAKVS